MAAPAAHCLPSRLHPAPLGPCALPPSPGRVQDAVAELAAAHFVGVLMRLRRRLAPLLLPPRFDSPRDIRWHAADASVAPIWDAELAGEAAGSGKLDTSFLAFSGARRPRRRCSLRPSSWGLLLFAFVGHALQSVWGRRGKASHPLSHPPGPRPPDAAAAVPSPQCAAPRASRCMWASTRTRTLSPPGCRRRR